MDLIGKGAILCVQNYALCAHNIGACLNIFRIVGWGQTLFWHPDLKS